MATYLVPLVGNEELTDENGEVLLVLATAFEGGNARLWEVYQEEMERRFRPKPKPKEPEPELIDEDEFKPAPPSGFFDAPMSPQEMFSRVRAAAEAKERQKTLNTKTISDLLRKARR